MFSDILGFISKCIVVDLGTVNTLIALKGKGIVLREPSCVAVTVDNEHELVAVGKDALTAAGRTPGGVEVIYPMKDGVIADIELAGEMLKYFLIKAVGRKNGAVGVRVAMSFPLCVTNVEKRALEETAKMIGARDVLLLDEPFSAAIGAGLPVFDAVGSMVVDIGGGTTDIAVLSYGGIARSLSIKVGGKHINEAICDYVLKQYGICLGERTCEDVKLTLLKALPGSMERMVIKGRNVRTGLPCNTVINAGEIRMAALPHLKLICDGVRKVLNETPPELAADLLEQGITLTGGGAYINGLDKLISNDTGLTVDIADEPLDCVAMGALKLMEGAFTATYIERIAQMH